jgi:hypothetical protein
MVSNKYTQVKLFKLCTNYDGIHWCESNSILFSYDISLKISSTLYICNVLIVLLQLCCDRITVNILTVYMTCVSVCMSVT